MVCGCCFMEALVTGSLSCQHYTPLHISSLFFVLWGRDFVLSLGVEEQQEDCGIPHFTQVVAQFCSPEFCLCLLRGEERIIVYTFNFLLLYLM